MRENAATLLKWYDAQARDLPWRVPPHLSKQGVRPDPYLVYLSEIMLQQTGVVVVCDYFNVFRKRWPDVMSLAEAEDGEVMAEWAGLGYYARARNLLKTARIVAWELDGKFPDTQANLQSLPGIGPYTSAAIATIAFDQPANVVDGNVERVMARIHAVQDPMPQIKSKLRDLADGMRPNERHGDYAQALMDLGATICTPRNPDCETCPLHQCCKAQKMGIQATLPRKTPKPAKPTRYGTIWLARREDGAILVEQRPEKGLLGGMLGLPTSDWAETPPNAEPPLSANWKLSPEAVKHTFTHFHLELTVGAAEVGQTREGFMHVAPNALPTVMRKALSRGLALLDD